LETIICTVLRLVEEHEFYIWDEPHSWHVSINHNMMNNRNC
jgi:hypothetical protein